MTFITESEIAWLVIVAGLIGWLWRAPPKWLHKSGLSALAGANLPAASGLLSGIDLPQLAQIGVFFAKAGAFVFGSRLAIVPFLYGGVVTEHHWLNDKQFVDAVAVAMITPGPVVITVGFIGYLVAGFPGAIVAALGTFLPCYLFTIIPAPYVKKYGHRADVKAFATALRRQPSVQSRAPSSSSRNARSSTSRPPSWPSRPICCCGASRSSRSR